MHMEPATFDVANKLSSHYICKIIKNNMQYTFALDLKVARRKTGLTQGDVAHLLGISDTRISRLENGKTHLSVHEIAGLSIIYGKSFENLFGIAIEEMLTEMPERIAHMPVCRDNWLGRFNRENTIDNIVARLEAEPEEDEALA